MARAIAMTKSDKKWQAESDARTLMEADVIKVDSTRLRAAANAAKLMKKEKQDEAKAMAKVAKLKKGKGKQQ